MDFIPLNIVSGYRGSVAAGRNFWEGKHQNNSHIPVSDAIVALYQDETARITSVFLTTKRLDDFGITKHETLTLVLRVPTSHAPATVNSILAAVNGFFRFMGWKDIAVKLLKIQKALFCDERRELTRSMPGWSAQLRRWAMSGCPWSCRPSAPLVPACPSCALSPLRP